jgi:hypothetical protein
MNDFENIYGGYIFLDKNNTIKKIYKEETTPLLKNLKQLVQRIKTQIYFSIPRKFFPYKGMIAWENDGGAMYLYAMKTHKRSSFTDSKQLYSELETIAKTMSFPVMRTCTYISPAIMKRFGWTLLDIYDEENKEENYKFYSKSFLNN